MRDGVRHLLFLAVGSLMLSAAPGCKVVGGWFSPADEAELGDPQPTNLVSDASIVNRETRQGLEVRLLVVDDTNYDTARALRGIEAASAGSGPVDAQTRALWSRWGFRIVAVPLDQLDTTLGSLRPVRPLSVQWLGEFGAWRPLVRSGENRQTLVRVGESTRSVEPGRPSLIARSWSVPLLSDRGVDRMLRVDLGMQVEASKGGSYELIPDRRRRTLDDQGLVIDELLSTLMLGGDHALVIVGESPGEDWDTLPDQASLFVSEPSDGQDDQVVGPEAEDDAGPSDGLEPKESVPFTSSSPAAVEPGVPALRSLGELMLVAPGSRLVKQGEARDIPKRVVIVLVPSVHGSFRMLSVPGSEGVVSP
ncbi:MAG: hypothetical protein CMJ35_15005 [Phycisphaerae bacterium]|nr:hypothetical protein [Phycisphaerae bacterium]